MAALTYHIQPPYAPRVTSHGVVSLHTQGDEILFWQGALLIADDQMRVAPIGEGVGRFIGICLRGGDRDTFGRIVVQAAPFVWHDASVTGISGWDGEVGRDVWCATDNPADMTLTHSEGAHRVGVVIRSMNAARANVLAMFEDNSVAYRLARQMLAREVLDPRELDAMERGQ